LTKVYSIASWCFFKHIMYSWYIISSLDESSSIFIRHPHSLSLLLSTFEIMFSTCLLQKMNFRLLYESQIGCILYTFAMFNQHFNNIIIIIIIIINLYVCIIHFEIIIISVTYLTAANKLHACAVHVICMASTLTMILIPTTIMAVV